MTPSVDVVILSLDRLEDTLHAIESVVSQRGVRPLLWIVDQGSDPSCLQALRQRTRDREGLHLIELGTNIGVAAGRNLGMSSGSAEIIVSIDNDAVFREDDALLTVVTRFGSDASLGAIGFRILNYETRDDDRGSWAYPRGLLDRSAEAFHTTRFCGAGHALRRGALLETNLYDERLFFYWEEVDLSYQLIARGFSIVYDPSIEILHKVSVDARTTWKGNRYYYLVRNAIYLEYKYFRSAARAGVKAAGYLLKGIYNGLTPQAVRGVKDAFKMARSITDERSIILDSRALEYIEEHEMVHRGPIWRRIRDEVFETLVDR